MQKKALIIGYGSIGRRHANVLCAMGYSISLVTQQTIPEYRHYQAIEKALITEKFDYLIIANPTSDHASVFNTMLNSGFKGHVLIEKPLFEKPYHFEVKNDALIYVGYNLRFNETLYQLKQLLHDEKIISFSARVGQYLPTWRNNLDYRENYSAKKNSGGGVLRDLSHELDYANWICGDCTDVTAIGGKLSDLEIDSDDTYSIIMRCQHSPVVMIHMDYLSRMNKREIYVQTKKHTYFADLINNMLLIDGIATYHESVNTYEKQHESILNNDVSRLCTYDQGMKTVNLIDLIEEANHSRKWMLV